MDFISLIVLLNWGEGCVAHLMNRQ